MPKTNLDHRDITFTLVDDSIYQYGEPLWLAMGSHLSPVILLPDLYVSLTDGTNQTANAVLKCSIFTTIGVLTSTPIMNLPTANNTSKPPLHEWKVSYYSRVYVLERMNLPAISANFPISMKETFFQLIQRFTTEPKHPHKKIVEKWLQLDTPFGQEYTNYLIHKLP